MALRTRSVVTVACCGALLTGCGGATRSGGSTVDQQALVVLRELARCVRANGIPTFPDPQIGSDGVPSYPDTAPRVPVSAQQACRRIAARIPPDYTSTTAVSSDDYTKLLRFARCIRAHGIPDWPDPNPLGEFPVNAHIIERGGKRLLIPAAHACARLNPNPDGGIHVVRVP